MTRNTKPEHLRKLAGIKVNGYKVDIANYLYNPAIGCEYPALVKMVNSDETRQEFKCLKYFKYYDGRGEYSVETYSTEKNGEAWQIVRDRKATVIEESNRYSLDHLQKLAANY